MFQTTRVFKAITFLEPLFRRVSFRDLTYRRCLYHWPLVEVCAGLKPVSKDTLISDSMLLMLIQDVKCDGLSLACCPNLVQSNFHWAISGLLDHADLSRNVSQPSQAPSFQKCRSFY